MLRQPSGFLAMTVASALPLRQARGGPHGDVEEPGKERADEDNAENEAHDKREIFLEFRFLVRRVFP